MSVCSAQDVQTFLGLPALDALALQVWPLGENHVCDFLGWEFIEQQTVTEMSPLDQAMPYLSDPVYVVNANHSRAVPANYYQANVIQLRHVPVRPTAQNTVVVEDWTGFFGEMPGSFPAGGTLQFGVDYFFKLEKPAQNGNLPICWSGQLERRTFWWPNTPGSLSVQYVAGFSPQELAGRYSVFKTACLETIADLYLRGKAISLGHFPNIASESDGGGVSVSYVAKALATEIPDSAALKLQKYQFAGEIGL